jgi:hypothetical protein
MELMTKPETSPDWIARFELVGSLYYRETGRLLPGKDEPPGTGRDSYDEENVSRYEEWAATKLFSALLDHAIALESRIERLDPEP